MSENRYQKVNQIVSGKSIDPSLIPHPSSGLRFRRQVIIDVPHSPVAQLVEQVTVNHRVGGSSPSRGAIALIRLTFVRHLCEILQRMLSLRRNLIIVRAGDQSLHPAWLADDNDRNWDIIVDYYGDRPDAFRDKGQTRIDCKGPKWPALSALMTGKHRELEAYDYVWFPDDDLVTDAASINRFFDICHEFALDLAQPSLTLDSIAGHIVTLANRSFRLRFTNFVEIMAPCFSRDFLKRCWPSFAANASGWGLDFLWPTWIEDPMKIAVIDEVSVRHTRTRGAQYALVNRQGKTPEQELAELARKENLSLVAMTRGGIGRDGGLCAIWNSGQKELIRKILAGYLPDLANYPEHIYTAIAPLLS
jgi:hypothetical protein